jgi:hypothetical protein
VGIELTASYARRKQGEIISMISGNSTNGATSKA